MFTRKKIGLLAVIVAFALLGTSLIAPLGAVSAATGRSPLENPEPVTLVRILVPGTDRLHQLVDAGYDLSGGLERVPHGLEVDAVLTASDILDLAQQGIGIVGFPNGDDLGLSHLLQSFTQFPADYVFETAIASDEDDTIVVGRADYFDTFGQGFISVEAKTSEGSVASTALTLRWDSGPGTPMGSGGSVNMSRYVDAGVYMYHRIQVAVDARPSRVQVTSNRGGESFGHVRDWLFAVSPRSSRPDYEIGFVDRYMNPTELYERIEELAELYPDISEIVYLPNKTNGYRRKAQAVLGSSNAAGVVLSSRAWGHEGGNNLTAQLVAPTGPDQPLTVTVDGNHIQVNLASNSAGNISTRAVDVVNAINADEAASALVEATTYRTTGGTGTAQATASTALTDFLKGDESISREPFEVRALRIGKTRDGSKPGVLIIAQDHAREYVPPLVALEAAERMLHNYATDAETKQIVDNTDIFIVPSNNPDGSHYSFFDFASQRRTMTNHCGPDNSDPGRRNNWGVDLNRNFAIASSHDGWSGGSSVCTNDTYAGPGKLSEPESQNVIWLVKTFPNVKFFMTVHSNGGQLFWQPGAYKSPGRETMPRPGLRDESNYWHMAERILSHVKSHQQTVVQPQNVGGSADVLYSSAGNVRENLYYVYGIYAFGWEVGGSVWNPETKRWVGGSFQPPFSRGYGETMEYANGIVEMFRIAMEYGLDNAAPVSQLYVAPEPGEAPGDNLAAGVHTRAVNVHFRLNEPADIYYTTDGSRPTLDSAKYKASGIREFGEVFTIDETTTFKWFAIDPAGNIENGYDPAGDGENYREAVVTIEAVPAVSITAPEDGFRTDKDVVSVTGAVADRSSVSGVTVNGRKAVVSSDGTFTARVVLREGTNEITAAVTDTSGHVSTATVAVIAIWSPPQLEDLEPVADVVLADGETTVLRFKSAANLTAAYQIVFDGTAGMTVSKGVPHGTSMTEVSPGVYEATYTAPAGTSFSQALIRFNVADDVGNLIRQTASGRLTVHPSLVAIH